MDDYGIKYRKTPPYAPQCIPVERVNKVIKTMIRQYIDKKKSNWNCHLTELQYAYNTTRHTSTGFTPAYLNTGREFLPPGFPDIRLHLKKSSVNKRFQKIKETLEFVKINLARNFQIQQKHFN